MITFTTYDLMDIGKKLLNLKFLTGLDRFPHINLDFKVLIPLQILFAVFPNF